MKINSNLRKLILCMLVLGMMLSSCSKNKNDDAESSVLSNNSTSEQTSEEQTSEEQTTEEQTTEGQTTAEQTTEQQTTAEQEPPVASNKQVLTISGKEYPFVSADATQFNNIHTQFGSTRIDRPYLVIQVKEAEWVNFGINVQTYDGATPGHNTWATCIYAKAMDDSIVTRIEKDGSHYYCFNLLEIKNARDETPLRDSEKYVCILMQTDFKNRTVENVYLDSTIDYLK